MPSVLITQKSKKAAENFQELIRGWGYDVAVTTELDTILDTIKTVKPDIIILGATADEPSSLKLSRDLRARPFNINIPHSYQRISGKLHHHHYIKISL